MLLTATEQDERIFATLRAGARGLLLKDTEPAELVRAIELLARGDALLSPSLTRRLIAELAYVPDPQLPSSELLDELTPREREVVALVALGLSNPDIAERLVISPATSKTHVSRAMLKLGAHDRAQLVVFAFHAGLAVPRPKRRPALWHWDGRDEAGLLDLGYEHAVAQIARPAAPRPGARRAVVQSVPVGSVLGDKAQSTKPRTRCWSRSRRRSSGAKDASA